jgi:hypothetical protein
LTELTEFLGGINGIFLGGGKELKERGGRVEAGGREIKFRDYQEAFPNATWERGRKVEKVGKQKAE